MSTPVALQVLRTVSGISLAGAQVLLQARTVRRGGLSVTEATVADGVTDATGRCTIAAAFAAGAAKPLLVRVLFMGAAGRGAAVPSRSRRTRP